MKKKGREEAHFQLRANFSTGDNVSSHGFQYQMLGIALRYFHLKRALSRFQLISKESAS